MKLFGIFKSRKRTLICVALSGVITVGAVALYVDYQMNYNITEVLPGELYRSSEINPTRLAELSKKNGISLVVDVRHPNLDDKDEPLGTTQTEIQESRQALIAAGIEHLSIPSTQIPSPAMVNAFLDIVEQREDQAILVHCDHGIGRTGVYVALYLMEDEGYSNEEAREVVSRYYSARIHGRKHFRPNYNKGKWIMDYVPRFRQTPHADI